MSDPRDLWALITAVPRAHKLVDFPKKNEQGEPICQVAIWVLTQNEQELAQASALERHEKMLARASSSTKESQKDDLYLNCAADELLFRCCRNPDDITKPFFPSVDAVRQLSVDEVGVLCTSYASVQEELGPIASRMSQEEMDAFVDKLAASSDRFPLDRCSPATLRALAFSMASRIASLRTDKSSPGSQQGRAPNNSASVREGASVHVSGVGDL